MDVRHRRSRTTRRALLSTVGLIAVVGTIAGCSKPADTATGPTSSTTSTVTSVAATTPRGTTPGTSKAAPGTTVPVADLVSEIDQIDKDLDDAGGDLQSGQSQAKTDPRG